jgi:adenosylcobinamide-phosphate synthase
MSVSQAELLAGVALDLCLGDPPWLPHPIRGLGWFIDRAERAWRSTKLPPRLSGALFTLTVTGFAGSVVRASSPALNVYWIFSLLACRSLSVESHVVVKALEQGNLVLARQKLSRIVGRDTADLDEAEVLRATVETMAENLSDGVIAPLFYLAATGPAGMAAYKAVNTLDSMVGYRNEKYRQFGWASARLDDVLNFIPARLSAMLVWLCAPAAGGSIRRSLAMTIRDGRSQPSPNAGYPEAAVAGALGIRLGGTNTYQGVVSKKEYLGDAIQPLTTETFYRVRRLLYACTAVSTAVLYRLFR